MKKILSIILLLCAAFSMELRADAIPVPEKTFYLIGDATLTGWTLGDAIPMVKKSDTLYEWVGQFLGGKGFKIQPVKSDYVKTSLNPTTDGLEITKSGLSATEFQYPRVDDYKWKIVEGGFYKITLDISNNTLAAEYLGDTFASMVPVVENLYLFGTAAEDNWEVPQLKMEKLSEGVFRYVGHLKGGNSTDQFRIAFNNIDYESIGLQANRTDTSDGALLCMNNYAGTTANNFVTPQMQYCKDSSSNWYVNVDGNYVITVDLNTMTINSKVQVEPNPGVYAVGDGVPNNGWNCANPTALTKVSDYVYVYRGLLNEGNQVKFALEKSSDWSGAWIKAPSTDYAITTEGFENVQFNYNPSDDPKFFVTNGGYYELTLDIAAHSISAKYLGADFAAMCPLKEDISIVGYAVSKGWTLGDAVKITKIDDYKYQYKGFLYGGGSDDTGYQFRFITNTVDFDALSLKPASSASIVALDSNGFAESGMAYRQNPDKNWYVIDGGYYTVNLDLQNMAISATDYMAELPTSATAVADNGTTEYYATFSNIYSDMELSVESGTIEVYNVKVSGDKLDLTKREGTKVACGEGVLVKASTPSIKVTQLSGEALTPAVYGEETLLVATPVSSKTVTAESGYKLYRLTFSDKDNQTGLGFYYGSNDGSSLEFSTPQPNKAYLKVPDTMAAQIKGFSLNPHPTHVDGINAEEQSCNEPIYDLSGRRVENPTKGFYLQGNKKIIVK